MVHLLKSVTAPETSSKQDTWRHTGVALAQLRSAIAETPSYNDDELILSVLFFAMLARAQGDASGFGIHAKNLAILVRERGGVNQLGYQGLLKSCVLQFDGFFAADSSQTMFPEGRELTPPVYPDPLMPPSFRKKVSELPLGFEHLALSGKVPLDLIEILERLATHSRSEDGVTPSKQLNLAWTQAKYPDFWSACPALATPGPNFDKFLCMSLLLYSANEFRPVRTSTGGGVTGMWLYSSSRTLLAQQIHLLGPLITGRTERQFWMWMWMVVIDSWSERGRLTATGERLLWGFREEFPEIMTWRELERVSKEFFWSEKLLAACMGYWECLPRSEVLIQ